MRPHLLPHFLCFLIFCLGMRKSLLPWGTEKFASTVNIDIMFPNIFFLDELDKLVILTMPVNSFRRKNK